MATVADDIIQRLSQLQLKRSNFENQWRQVANVAAPEAAAFTQLGTMGVLSNMPQQASAANRSKYIFDSTAINAVDRLASGIEDIVVPQSGAYWHGFGLQDLTHEQYTDAEARWLERLRNVAFKVRYDADSGFVTAIQTAIRRVVAFGNAFIWVEDDPDYQRKAMILYRYMPLAQCYVSEDHLGIVTCFYRYYELTAAQAYSKFKERCPAKIKQAAETPEGKDRSFKFIQTVEPRGEYGLPTDGVRSTKFASLHVSVDEKEVIRESGFFEFPVIDFRWLPEPGNTYGEGPVMKCIADIQSLQQMAKNELLAGEQAVRPPLLVANAGIVNRPDARPAGITMGGMNAQGQRLIEPLFQGQRLDFATAVLEAKRNQVKESMYLNLFQILLREDPRKTATEALIKANEKGALLGPAGSRLQQSLSRMIDRELGIMERRGLYDGDSVFRKPASLQGRDVIAQMSSPLDRLRRSKEGEGILRVLEIISPLAQVDPTVIDSIDADSTLRELRDIFGAPVGMMKTTEEVEKIRAARAQQQTLAANAEIAETLAGASKQGSDAVAGMREAGVL